MTTTNPTVDGYSGPAVYQLTGVTYRQLDYWARTNLIRPSHTDAHGSGTARRYTLADVILIRLTALLIRQGVSLQRIRDTIIDQAREQLDRDVPGPIHVDRGGCLMLTIDLPAVIADTHRRLAAA